MTAGAPRAAESPRIHEPLAELFVRLAHGGDRALLARTVTLLCQERDQGHVCVPLRDWQRRPLPGGDGESTAPFPGVAAWRTDLLATGLCAEAGREGPALPLVLDGQDRLYLLRHWRTEQRLLAALHERLAHPPLLTAAAVHEALAATGGAAAAGAGPDLQTAAVAAAARSAFTVLTGGPGTGKTTTVARLLAVLWTLQPDLRTALAAPTGKAAARLGEALAQRAAALPALQQAASRLQPQTLHRLLGYLPLDDAFRHGRDRRLPYDVVVVDEVSMVDPAVLAQLFDALPPGARVVLVGDRDQLAAVAAGQVLGDLCRAAGPERGAGRALATFVREATGVVLPLQENAPAIADHVVALRHSHRFGSLPGIGAFAAAMAARDDTAAMAALRAGHADLRLCGSSDEALAAIADELLAAVRATTAAEALAALARVRVLTATRHGAQGALAWNTRVESLLRSHGVRVDDPWYRGRPVLVVQNDWQNQVWNGDLGVAWRGDDSDGERPQVVFAAPDGTVRAIAVQRLPAHETAWAMTVHKAQGSEFDTVLLVMPDTPGPAWQAPLVYTGLTRARRRALLLAPDAPLRACLAHWPERSSGLADGLGGARSRSGDDVSTPA